MPAIKKQGTRTARAQRKPADLMRLNVWTPRQASAWSGIGYRPLLRLIQTGAVPAITGAPARPTITDHRVYLLSRVRFIAWLEGRDVAPATGENAA